MGVIFNNGVHYGNGSKILTSYEALMENEESNCSAEATAIKEGFEKIQSDTAKALQWEEI